MKGNNPLFSNYSYGSSYSSYGDGTASPSPLNGQSQPYQDEYHVYSKMKEKDARHGVYKNGTGYSMNPTAKPLDSILNGNYIGDKLMNKMVPYVITTSGSVIIGDRNGNGKGPGKLPTPHPTLIGGTDPKVRMAGMLDIRGGKIYSYDNLSGHYRPNERSMKFADEAFAKYPKHKKFKGGNK